MEMRRHEHVGQFTLQQGKEGECLEGIGLPDCIRDAQFIHPGITERLTDGEGLIGINFPFIRTVKCRRDAGTDEIVPFLHFLD